MLLKEFSLLLLSSIFYSLSFIFIDHAWYLVFLFFLPFLYEVYAHPISMLHGFVWGASLVLLHGIGWIPVLLILTKDHYVMTYLIIFGMAVYIGLFSAILFWLTSQCIHRFFSHFNPYIKIFSWIISILIFVEWINNYCLIIGGVWEGFPLMHPLLPLTDKPSLLQCLPYVGVHGMTFLLLLISSSLFLFMHNKNKLSLAFVILCLFPWIYCYYIPIYTPCFDSLSLTPRLQRTHHTGTPILAPSLFFRWAPQLKNAIGDNKWGMIKSLPLMMRFDRNDDEMATKIIQYKLQQIIAEYPDTEIIVMPESALTLDCFESKPELFTVWSQQYLKKPIHFIFGTTHYDGDDHYNAVYWMYDGQVKEYYYKTHAMVITERLPSWLHKFFSWLHINDNNTFITKGINKRPCLSLMPEINCIPYICSEFFFNPLDKNEKDRIILLLVNDALFAAHRYSRYIQRLLLAVAQIRAIEYKKEIVYASYAYSCVITKNGICIDMD